MLLLSYCVGLVPLDPDHVLALRGFERVAFKRPVRIGDTIHVEGELESRRSSTPPAASSSSPGRSSTSAASSVALAKVKVLWRRARRSAAPAEPALGPSEVYL